MVLDAMQLFECAVRREAGVCRTQAGAHDPVQVGQWKKDIQEQAGTLFEGKGQGRWRITKSRTGSTARSAD